eukprot:UN03526
MLANKTPQYHQPCYGTPGFQHERKEAYCSSNETTRSM